jgi:hypothetical protein
MLILEGFLPAVNVSIHMNKFKNNAQSTTTDFSVLFSINLNLNGNFWRLVLLHFCISCRFYLWYLMYTIRRMYKLSRKFM